MHHIVDAPHRCCAASYIELAATRCVDDISTGIAVAEAWIGASSVATGATVVARTNAGLRAPVPRAVLECDSAAHERSHTTGEAMASAPLQLIGGELRSPPFQMQYSAIPPWSFCFDLPALVHLSSVLLADFTPSTLYRMFLAVKVQ